MAEGKGKSPYQRRGKQPFRYSEIYQKWRSAALSGNPSEASFHARAHYRRFVLGQAREAQHDE